jgi:hypothetical protein
VLVHVNIILFKLTVNQNHPSKLSVNVVKTCVCQVFLTYLGASVLLPNPEKDELLHYMYAHKNTTLKHLIVLLLGFFRRVTRPVTTRGNLVSF